MALELGSRLGHYDVTAFIGEGGMGQVYSATDTKLNRQVALKILPEAFASDPGPRPTGLVAERRPCRIDASRRACCNNAALTCARWTWNGPEHLTLAPRRPRCGDGYGR